MRLRLLMLAIIAAISVPAQAYRIALWIPPWSSAATTTIQLHAGSVTESNPVWYVLNADGSVAKAAYANTESATVLAAMTGTRVVPTIQNVIAGSWSGAGVAAILADPAKRGAHIDSIFQLVTSKAFDGIDIDYESMPNSANADFTAFVTALAEKLHSAGKTLSVTVAAKTSGTQTWNVAEDYPAIGSAADSVKVMCYDYSWSTSAPGPISPLSWIDKVVSYAESAIPPAKLYIGLPFFGYDWAPAGSGWKGAGVSYASATSIAQTNAATIGRDDNGEGTFTYGGTHTVFFQDAFAYTKKVELVMQKHPAVGGFAHWAAGQEDPAIWDVIAARLFGNPAEPPAGDFSISGPASISVQQGSSTAAGYTLTAINGFTGSATVSVLPSSDFAGSVQLSSDSISASSPVTVTILPGSPPVGAYPITLRFAAGSVVHDVVVSVNVIPAAPRTRAVRH